MVAPSPSVALTSPQTPPESLGTAIRTAIPTGDGRSVAIRCADLTAHAPGSWGNAIRTAIPTGDGRSVAIRCADLRHVLAAFPQRVPYNGCSVSLFASITIPRCATPSTSRHPPIDSSIKGLSRTAHSIASNHRIQRTAHPCSDTRTVGSW